LYFSIQRAIDARSSSKLRYSAVQTSSSFKLRWNRSMSPLPFGVMIRRPPMDDAEPTEGLQEARRSELRPIGGGQRHVLLAAARGQPFEHGLLHHCQRVFGPTAMREIPSHDLPRAAVNHAHQVRPAHAQQENEFIRLHGIHEYAKWHLGIDDEEDEQNKRRYKFHYGAFEKVVELLQRKAERGNSHITT
jgi:hypothetical protein